MKVLFSINQTIIAELKKRVTARKRSQLVEKLLVEFFEKDDKHQGWDAIHSLRSTYKKPTDPIRLSAVEWINLDRSGH